MPQANLAISAENQSFGSLHRNGFSNRRSRTRCAGLLVSDGMWGMRPAKSGPESSQTFPSTAESQRTSPDIGSIAQSLPNLPQLCRARIYTVASSSDCPATLNKPRICPGLARFAWADFRTCLKAIVEQFAWRRCFSRRPLVGCALGRSPQSKSVYLLQSASLSCQHCARSCVGIRWRRCRAPALIIW